ncbi:uncharacterized protein VP01_1566g5 [Puccinia sorghi]|uniref:Uncharacterized protein n=1 Tax=Puccinia sorghi TaxID=27349 RepID=A0A0L6VHY6_9BASI|nr:uncharacterized protein VP01_1566g5 [Puccinia sorghi]
MAAPGRQSGYASIPSQLFQHITIQLSGKQNITARDVQVIINSAYGESTQFVSHPNSSVSILRTFQQTVYAQTKSTIQRNSALGSVGCPGGPTPEIMSSPLSIISGVATIRHLLQLTPKLLPKLKRHKLLKEYSKKGWTGPSTPAGGGCRSSSLESSSSELPSVALRFDAAFLAASSRNTLEPPGSPPSQPVWLLWMDYPSQSKGPPWSCQHRKLRQAIHGTSLQNQFPHYCLGMRGEAFRNHTGPAPGKWRSQAGITKDQNSSKDITSTLTKTGTSPPSLLLYFRKATMILTGFPYMVTHAMVIWTLLVNITGTLAHWHALKGKVSWKNSIWSGRLRIDCKSPGGENIGGFCWQDLENQGALNYSDRKGVREARVQTNWWSPILDCYWQDRWRIWKARLEFREWERQRCKGYPYPGMPYRNKAPHAQYWTPPSWRGRGMQLEKYIQYLCDDTHMHHETKLLRRALCNGKNSFSKMVLPGMSKNFFSLLLLLTNITQASLIYSPLFLISLVYHLTISLVVVVVVFFSSFHFLVS